MIFDVRKSKEFVKSISLTEFDQISCFRDLTITGEKSAHWVSISELEYSKEDNAFCCPKHKVMLLKGIGS